MDYVFLIIFIIVLSLFYMVIARFGYIRGFNKGHYKGFQEGLNMAITSFGDESEKKTKRKINLQQITHLRVVKRDNDETN